MRRFLVGLCPLLLVPGLLVGTADAAPPAEPPSGRMVLLLDSSGSMAEPAAGGGTKIDAAKQALGEVADRIPEGVDVGARVFGATVENGGLPGACRDTQSVVPVGPLDRDALDAAVADYRPYGETPIGNALKAAAEDLGPGEEGVRRTIVLLSDGEPTCEPDPCAVAAQLRGQGIDLRINVVGLSVSGEARRALRCIAENGGGRYFDADSAEELSDSLVQVSVRGLREFALTGTPVTGGRTAADATSLDPGEYVDTTRPRGAPLVYSVELPEDGGVDVTAVLRPGAGDLADVAKVELLAPDGTLCETSVLLDRNLLGLSSIIGVSASYFSGLTPTGLTQESCTDAEQLLVQVTFDGPPTPFGLRVRSHPAVENLTSLPPPGPADELPTRPVPLRGPGTPVVGGASFEDAAELTPGTTYVDSIRPREQLIYKVSVGYGQRPRFTARLEPDARADDLVDLFGIQTVTRSFSPALGGIQGVQDSAAGVSSIERYRGDSPVTLSTVHRVVRLRNLEDSEAGKGDWAFAGDYYFTVEMASGDSPAEERFAAPMRLAVAVDGEVTGEPELAVDDEEQEQQDEAPAQEAPAREDDASPALPIGIGAGLGLLLLGGVAILARRQGRGD